MDLSTILGIVVGFGMLITGFVMEGGEVGALFLLSPAIIVFGGTLGALMISFTMKDIQSIPRLLKDSMTLHQSNEDTLIKEFEKLSEISRKEGLLSLENAIAGEEANQFDPMLKKGIRMVVDGTDLEFVKNMFETEMYVKEQVKKNEAAIFEAAGGYSPTLGIIGTVMGLVHVLGNLTSPEALSKSIAGAFIATLYGVCFANLVYLPIANKLKLKMKQARLEKELIMEGVLSIQAGENPTIIREKLSAFRTNQSKQAANEGEQEEEA